MEEAEEITSANEIAAKAVKKLMENETNPLIIAAVFATTGLSIYRMILNDAEYNTMVDTISDSRGDILTYTPTRETIH
tara:strand:+ start:150 stop:383 length:234 start_codon:yes stop_codon:yes gene_type:complete